MSIPLRHLLTGLSAGTLILSGCSSTHYQAPVVERNLQRPPPRPVQAMPGQYVVQPGDTLYKIAFENGLDYRELAAWNNLSDPDRIFVGSTLRLQRPNLPPPSKPVNAAPAVNAVAPAPATAPTFQDPELPPANWVWPVKGRIISSFSEAEGRKGHDIAAPLGTPVLASAAGRVVYVGNGLRGYGKLIIIKHSKTLLSAYAHQSRMLVKEGELVKQGQKIGEVGNTDADQMKLHFEIRNNGKPVNPSEYLPS